MINIRPYFENFELFVQLLYLFRKRLLDRYFRVFRRRIVRRINIYVGSSINNRDFIDRLSDILYVPEGIDIDSSAKDAIIYQAEKAVNGKYNLLGSGDVEVNPIDWHTDFKTGHKWQPGTFHRNYIQEGIESESDVKVPRELSRCHHLLKLCLAYRFTANEKYAEVCISQILDWIRQNPVMYSINWGCTMDVAIRAVNWMWALRLIAGSEKLDNAAIEKIKISLYQHGWYIYRNPEKEFVNNSNHYLSDLSGQVHLGLLFSGLKEPTQWLKSGMEELFREIRMEILPTGMSYERSTNYNRLVLEIILVPTLVLKRNKHEVPSDIWYRLEKMFEFIMYSLKPDGTTPIVGDQDNGRLLPFGTEPLINFRYLLSLGAVLFHRADFKHNGEGFNIYSAILGGEGASDKWNSIPEIPSELESKSFPDTGIYIMRDSDNYLMFNATGMGKYPELSPAGHTHSDLFSFELFTSGKSFLIDPGSYVYTADADMRMLFRSTKMHNTVTVDGHSQNNIRKEMLWRYSRDAVPEGLKWESDNKMDLVSAVHNGYARLEDPVLHERTVIFDKVNKKWLIKDNLKGKGSHIIEWFFHFDVGIDFAINGNKVETTCKDEKNIVLTFETKPGLMLRKEKSYVSKSYGIKEEGDVLVALINDLLPVKLTIDIKILNKV